MERPERPDKSEEKRCVCNGTLPSLLTVRSKLHRREDPCGGHGRAKHQVKSRNEVLKAAGKSELALVGEDTTLRLRGQGDGGTATMGGPGRAP